MWATSINLISGAIGVVRSLLAIRTYVRVRLRLLANPFLATHPYKWVNRGALCKEYSTQK